MKSRKKLLMVLVGICFCYVLSSCEKNEVKEEKKDTVISIPVIFRVNLETGEKDEEKLVKKFNEIYKDKYYIDVTWVMETEEEYRTNLKKMNVMDKLPAIIFDAQIIPSFYEMMVEDGRLTDLSPYIEGDEELKDMLGTQILENAREKDGKIYACPVENEMFSCAGFFWNKELFKKAGIKEFPTTWEDFWKVCDKLKENDIIPLSLHTGGTGWSAMLIATSEALNVKGGKEFMEELLPASYNNETGLRIAKTLKKIFQYTTEDALHNDFDVAHKNFCDGKTAMLANGYWEIQQLDEKIYDKVAFSTFPENRSVFSVYSWSIINTYSDEVKQGAIEFIKFRISERKKQREIFLAMTLDREDVKGDYARAIVNEPTLIPSYQMKWNSILQEEVIEESLPLLAKGEITPEQFVEREDESIRRYNMEQ
ncbi:MAG: ABC transporter substrate-binding protein [Lachnospiraceae bacterium]